MNNRGVSAMQVGSRIEDRGHGNYNLGQWKTLLRLLQPQYLKIRLFDITHQHVCSTEPIVIEGILDTRQCSTIKRCERYIVKGKAIPFLFNGVDHLRQSKKILFVTLIPNKIDVAKITFAKQTLYDVMLVYDRPHRERRLCSLHVLPPCTFF